MSNYELEDKFHAEIMLVDDTLGNLKLLTEMLTTEGFKVRPANSGELALESVAVKLPDLILLDVKMPGLDGYEVCRRLKADENSCKIPIIFISALDEIEDKVMGFKVGGVDYITKPFEHSEVLARVKTHLELRRLQLLQEQALADSEAKYKSLFDKLFTGYASFQIITDEQERPIDYVILEVNPAYEKITNLKRNEIIGKKATELFPGVEDSSVNWVRILGEVAMTGRPVSIEVYSDITDRWYDVFYYRSKLKQTSGVFSDITERKHSEEELRKVKKMLLEAQEFAHLGYLELDTMSGNYFWSDELFRIFGFKPQEFKPTNDDLIKIVHPDDKDLVRNTMEIPSDGSEQELEFRIIRQDKETIWIHCKKGYEFHVSGKPARIIGVVQDITLQKLSEIKLKESEEKFKEIAENLGEVIWVEQQDGRIVYINSAYEKVWGRTCQSLYDKPESFMESIHPSDKERVIQSYLLENDTSNGSADDHYRIIRPDGVISWIWSRMFPIYDGKGKIVRKVGIGDDITKIKEYEESLRLAKKEAETANKAKSQFLANMSHEIRTPMSGIVGFIELLSSMPLEREQACYLAEIKASTDALLTLINDILDYSKIEAGKLLIETIPFNIIRLVEETVSLFSPRAYKKGIEIISHITTGVPSEVQGDLGKLRQVLSNIIGNAVKFTDKGEVLVKVGRLKESKEKVLLQFEIQDTGIGISDETKQKLFQIFMQADASTTRKYEGTGLGLAISKKILELMGGKIEVISELDKGSTFVITLELEKGQMEDAEQKTRPLKPTILNGLKVMIVDDNASNRIIFSEYLSETGCKVISANDGIAGLEILKGLTSESLPQIVLVDYMMPGLSGLEFGEQLLKDERLKDIKLILITSLAQKGDAKLAQTIGFFGHLSKPVRKKELIDVISGVDVPETPGTTEIIVTRHLMIEKHNVPTISILLVEDMLANQRLEMAMLKKLGYSVELAINGKQAVEICNTKKYDLILMDCQMPVMDGYEATDQIRKASIFNKNTTIIAMTAHAMKGDREKCLEAGMDDYISKPITMAIIEDTIGKYFQEIIPDSL
jgi:PAS domain S-box-containing protein